jgi:hypothetical protein
MDNEGDGIAPRQFFCPANNEFFRVVIEVLLVKWRWILEELLDTIDKNFDSVVRSLMGFQVLH